MMKINKDYVPAPPEIRFERIVHPVGHGAFITELFSCDCNDSNFTVVYDCGSQKKELIEKEISTFFASGTQVDVLFISHFDDDHVNGLHKLRKHLKPDAKVIIPFYNKALLRVYPNYMSKAIELVNRELGDRWQIIMVSNNNNSNDYNGRILDIDEMGDNLSIETGTKLRKRINSEVMWEYVPFNLFNEPKIIEKIKNDSSIDIDNPKKWDDSTIKRIRNYFNDKKLNGGHSINENSLIILSHAVNFNRIYSFVFNQEITNCHNSNGQFKDVQSMYFSDMITAALYTGDSKMKASYNLNAKTLTVYDNFLLKLRNHYTRCISLFQIPHHGSSNNSNLATLLDAMMLRLFVNYSVNDQTNNSSILNNNNIELRLHKPVYKVDTKQYSETIIIK